MSRYSDLPERPAESHPTFERLEDRLLLTTLHPGQYLIYHNSMGDTVRLTFEDPYNYESAIEVLAHYGGQLSDLPGIRSDSISGVQTGAFAGNSPALAGLEYRWTGLPDSPLTSSRILRPADPYSNDKWEDRQFTEIRSNNAMWLEHGDYYPVVPNPNPAQESDWAKVDRGSRAEIFAIMGLTTSPTSVVTITVLSGTPFRDDRLDWTRDINPWGSTNLPLISTHMTNNPIQPPTGSGGVLVGAVHSPQRNNTPRWLGVSENTPVTNVPRIGLFAGGTVYSGVTVVSDIFRIPSVERLGSEIYASAMDRFGYIYSVDSNAFRGVTVNTGAAGNLGGGIQAIAANSLGQIFTVDNAPGPAIISSQAAFVGNANSLAYGGGWFYAVDENTRHLIRMNLSGQRVDRGLLTDKDHATYHYDSVVAMDYNTSNNTLWAVATLVDTQPNQNPSPASTGPFLIQIPTSNPVNNRLTVQVKVQLNVPSGQNDPKPWPNPATAPGLSTIAWGPTGGQLFGVTTTNQLVTINSLTGLYVPIGWSDVNQSATGLLKVGATNLRGTVVGLDFIGQTLYGITSEGELFYLNDGNVLTNPAAVDPSKVVLLGDTGLVGVASMTTNPADATRVFTISPDASGALRLTSVPLYSSLKSITTGGVATSVAPLYDSVTTTLLYTNVTGLVFRNDVLYGIATQVDANPADGDNAVAGRHIVTINTASGEATRVHTLVGPSDLTSLAWDMSNDLFHGVDPADNALWELNPAGWGETQGPALIGTLGTILGLDWASIGGSSMLLAVDATRLYFVDPVAGTCTELDNTGSVALTGLTRDPARPGYLWAVDNTDYNATSAQFGDVYRLVSISLTSRLVSADGRGTVQERGLLFDAAEPSYVYRNVTAMDFDRSGYLYAVAEIIALDPAIPVPSVNDYKWLVRIDRYTGVVTRVAELDVADLSAIAFDESNAMFGFDPGAGAGDGMLVRVDAATGVTTPERPVALNVVGMDFIGDTLYAVTAGGLYTIDLITGATAQVQGGILPTGPTGKGVTDLTTGQDPFTGEDVLWAPWLSEAENVYYLLTVFTDPNAAVQDFGRIIIAGTLAGEIINAGNIDLVEVGFLWGGVTSTRANLNSVLMRQGGGGVPANNYFAYQAHYEPLRGYVGESLISAFGVVNFVDSRNGAMLHTAVQADFEPTALPPSWLGVDDLLTPMTDLQELEEHVDPRIFNQEWLRGVLVDYDNGSQQTVQFLNFQSGEKVRVSGTMTRFEPSSQLPDGTTVPTDWYALPLVAGETITVDAWATMGFLYVPLLQHWPRGIPDVRIRLYDSKGNWLDSLGWETVEDWGVGSRPGADGTQKLMQFTAPAADVYYLVVLHHDPGYDCMYYVDVWNAPQMALGGVNIEGEYFAGLHYATGLADGYSFATKNGGDLGAVVASGRTWGPSLRTIGGGNIRAMIGGEIGSFWRTGYIPGAITSEGHVGRVASSSAHVCAAITAGALPLTTGALLNNNAHVYNIYTATQFLQTAGGSSSVTATGSIGVVQVTTNMGGVPFTVNSDNFGTYGHIDLIDVGGDWGSTASVPLLRRGAKGDVGFVRVGGTIYVDYGAWRGPLTETTLTQGQTAILNDDGGGQLTVTPIATPMLDPQTGQPLLDQFGRVSMYMPTVSYAYIGVDDDANPGVGDGGVIANLRISGAAQLTAKGTVQISNLDLNYNPNDSTPRYLTISGNAPVDIYYVQCSQPFEAITNETEGGIVSGDIGGMSALTLRRGSLGVKTSELGVWLHGPTDAPVSAGVGTEPQYGWYNGKINGLNVTGDLPYALIGGYLGDLRVTGRIGTVIVNSDKTSKPGEWHGVRGLVWSGQRIDYIDVGHGLADDGPSDRPKAGIMSAGSIGAVVVKGPYRMINGVAYGELNGAIFGAADTTIQIPNPDGTFTNIVQEALGQILGSDGARMTAICGSLALDSFRCDMTSTPGFNGSVGRIVFSGLGSLIHGAEAAGLYVREFTAALESLGMQNSYISGTGAPADGLAVGRVAAGGPGLFNVTISANGGNIGTIEGLGSVADILSSNFVTTDGIGTIRARHLQQTYISAPGTLNTVTVTGNLVGNYNALYTLTDFSVDPGRVYPTYLPLGMVPIVTEVNGAGWLLGALKSITVAGHFVDNAFAVAGELGRLSIGGNFENSVLRISGAAANLKLLEVGGDIKTSERNLNPTYANEVEIRSGGKIGSVITKTGAIYASIATTPASGAPSSDIGLIRTAAGYFGGLDVAGSLGALECLADLGRNPALYPDSQLQIFNIQGKLGRLKISGTRTNPSNLYADINVGGNIDRIDIDGDYFGQVFSLGDLGRITVKGLFGGSPWEAYRAEYRREHGGAEPPDVPVLVGNRGSLEVLGKIGLMYLSREGDLAADIISGGSIRNISIRNGDITGNIISRNGDILGISVVNGNIVGNVTGAAIRSISVSNGSILGDVTATNGDIRSLRVSGRRNDPATGNIQANVIANNGRILSLSATGNVGAAGQDFTVSATNGIKRATVGGDLLANVVTDGILDALSVRGNMNGVLVGADGGIRRLDVVGDVNDATVRAGASLDRFYVRGNLLDSTVSAGWNIGTASVRGDVTGSMFLAGYDVGGNVASVFFGNGLGGLAAQRPVPLGPAPLAVTLADVNDDGVPDLLAINAGNDTISVMLGNGDGTFGMRRNYVAGSQPSALAVGDVTGDLIVDLVVANQGDNTVTILVGNNDGTFGSPTTVNVGSEPAGLALADVDGDGNLDIAVANRGDNTVSILRNQGGGTFAEDPAPLGTGIAPVAVALADLDDDDVPDLVTANRDGASASVYLNNGDGTFGIHFVYPIAGGVSADGLAIGDVDGIDGPDILVTDGGAGNLVVFLNTGPGLFIGGGVASAVGANPGAVAVGFFDGDSNLDAVVVNHGDETVTVLLGDGTGAFPLAGQTALSAGESPAGLAVGDLDNDDDLDIIVANQTGGSNPLNNGAAHSGDIRSLYIGGVMTNSTVAAGIDPGPNFDFASFADNVPAPGYSTIGRVTVRGGFGANPDGNVFVADSGIYERFRQEAEALGVRVPGADEFAPAVVEDAGDFGPDTAARITKLDLGDGLTITLTGAGMANYQIDPGDPTVGVLTLKGTTSRSSVRIDYRGGGVYPQTIRIEGTEDGALSSLTVRGDVFLEDITVDGPIRSLSAGGAANANWSVPGGIGTVRLGALTNVNVLAGAIRSWYMTGAFAGGGLVADQVGSFYTRAASTANVTSVLGDVRSFSIYGDYTGQLNTFLGLRSVSIRGDFDGTIAVQRGDMSTMRVSGDFTGRVDVDRGEVRSVGITGGDFGVSPVVNPNDDTAFRSSGGVGSFIVSRGNFYGLLSTDGDLGTVSASRGVMAGKARAGGDIRSASFASMGMLVPQGAFMNGLQYGGFVSAGGDFRTIRVNGDMFASSFYSGFDPGDAGHSDDANVRAGNVRLDAFTEAGYRTPANRDRALGGDIGYLYVRGDMGLAFNTDSGLYEYGGCTISAGVDPGEDGFVGTTDDIVGGTGYIGRAYVYGGIYGNNVPTESYGFFAASAVPTVTAWKGNAFGGNENVYVGTVPPAVGALQIIGVNVQLRTLTVFFNHAINFGTITTETFVLIASSDDLLGNADDVNVLLETASTLTYDSQHYAVVVTLPGTTTWNDLGNYYRLTLDGARVRDIRLSALDGEFSGTFPSGDRRPGGDFVYDFVYGSKVLDRVPAYMWHYGCVPTAIGMLVGYYDRTSGDLANLIPGDASWQTAAVNAIIASPGTDGPDTDTLPDLLTGHVPDYAEYNGVNDQYWYGYAYPDISDPAVQQSRGVSQLRPNDCIADFVMASRSYVDATTSFTYGNTDHPYIEDGIEAFFAWTGHSAAATLYTYASDAEFDAMWATYINEINAGRPVLLGVSRYGFGAIDHAVIGIGYDMATGQYACFNTYSSQINWYSWAQIGSFGQYAVGDMTTVVVTP